MLSGSWTGMVLVASGLTCSVSAGCRVETLTGLWLGVAAPSEDVFWRSSHELGAAAACVSADMLRANTCSS